LITLFEELKVTAQSVILPLPSDHARFIVIGLGQLSIQQLKQQLQSLLSTRDRLISQYPDAEIKTAIAFGPDLWAKLSHDSPENFHQLQPLYGTFEMPVEAADVLIHLACARADLCFALAQAFFDGIQDRVEIFEERACFRYLEGRDLTGFIDGTENPQLQAERAETALLPEDSGVFADGSFVFAQRFVHDLDKWRKLKVDAQEQVIGRSKLESIELEDAHKPSNAHISRVVIEDEQGEELEILRHSLPYGEGHAEQGLFFIAYTKDLKIIDQMLAHMYGTSSDQLHDRLLHFVRPVNGAYYFAPSDQLLNRLLDSSI
jgi:putative iron-dependent peroxidase